MKNIFITFLLCCLSVTAFGQVAGGHISRPTTKKQAKTPANEGQIGRNRTTPVTIEKRKKPNLPPNSVKLENGTIIIYEITKEVDLGLSSGTIWAGWNIGATSPEGIGEYYAWGEIFPKIYYDWTNYFDTKKIINEDGPIEFKKYHVNGILSIIGTEHDVARMKWGEPWKMPTKAQLEELIRECEVHRVKLKGENNYNYVIFKGPNGKSILFPMAGNKYKTELRASWCEICWSGELRPYAEASTQNSEFAYHLASDRIYAEGFRCYGMNVRAVRSK